MRRRGGGRSPCRPTAPRNGSSFREHPAMFRSKPKPESATSGSPRSGQVVNRMRDAIAPLYLLLCLILGGSAQGIWANMLLQLLGLAILAWAALAPAGEPLVAPARQLLILAAIAIAIVGIQLVPLPPTLWPHLAGRAPIANGFRILGVGMPALPLSLTPYASIDSLLGLIPPLALFCAIVRLKAYRTGWLATVLLVGTVAGILLGALQV